VLLQVGGTGGQQQAAAGQAPRDQRGVGQLAREAQRDVEAVLDQVHDAVVAHQVHLQSGILRDEARQPGGQFQRAERHRRIDAQAAGRARLVLADCAVGFVQCVEDLPAGFVVLLAGGGEGEAARVAVEELGAEHGFQLFDLARHRRVRDAERFGGRRETAQLNDAAQCAQRGQLVDARGLPQGRAARQAKRRPSSGKPFMNSPAGRRLPPGFCRDVRRSEPEPQATTMP
jgi:hypothetical protein